MPAKRKNQKGAGVIDLLKFVKRNQLISKGLGILPHPAAQVAARVASMVGLGKKKRKPRKKAPTQRGKGIFSDIGNGLGGLARGIGGGLFGGAKKSKGRKGLIKL